jgi:CheY-like chemotaxis protein
MTTTPKAITKKLPVAMPEAMDTASDILIVDDTPANLDLLCGMLRDRGYGVRVATSGPRALAAVSAKRPDLLLLDVTMPGMNGYDVCRQLKADDALRGIPVIFISALDEVVDKVRAFESGGADYVTKPEQMCAQPLDGHADVYSLAMMVYEMLTGTLPFDDGSHVMSMLKLTEDPAPMRTHAPAIPQGLDEVVLSALRREPKARPTVTRFEELLVRAVSGE